MTVFCTKCGGANENGISFCDRCGAALGNQEEAITPALMAPHGSPASAKKSVASAIVRLPISFKIFGIAVTLLVLMMAVTLSSSLNLHRVGQELVLLSDFYQ